eukprot:7034459-Prymnesium_polylepis.1
MAVVVRVEVSVPGSMLTVASRYEPNHDRKPSRAQPHPINPSSVACTERNERMFAAFWKNVAVAAVLPAGAASLLAVLSAGMSTV